MKQIKLRNVKQVKDCETRSVYNVEFRSEKQITCVVLILSLSVYRFEEVWEELQAYMVKLPEAKCKA